MEHIYPSHSENELLQKLTILIVEDNFLNRRMIKKALEVGYFVKEATSAEDAIDILISGRVHLALLDINLGSSKDGIWLGEMIRVQYKIPFVYLTAYGENDIARKAIATQPDAYLTKPFKEVDLTAAIEIALQKVKESTYKKESWIFVKDGNCLVKLFLDRVYYFESAGNYLNIYCDGKVFKLRSTIKEMLMKLPHDEFVQIHRAYIVNKNKISKFSKLQIFIGTTVLPVSENYASNLEQNEF